MRNHCTLLQRQDKTKHNKEAFRKIETEKDSGKLFNFTKELLSWKSSPPPTGFLQDGKMYRKQKDIANIQAKFYRDKVNNIKRNLPRTEGDPLQVLKMAFEKWQPKHNIPIFKYKEVTESEVLKLITSLKNSSAFGHDEISATTLKIGAKFLAKPITHIINLSLGKGKFPMKWKLARVLPLLKSSDSDKLSPGSFHPLSQLSTISKLVERSLHSQLLEHLEKQELLLQDHHAYRKHLGTTSAIIQIMDTITSGADSNEFVATLSIDQTAAFDCVNHDLLLKKLEHYSLDNTTLEWIRQYLTQRTSYVSIGSQNSDMMKVDFGVLQGSVLGLILYLLYVNELSNVIKEDDCPDSSHNDKRRLFGNECKECGQLPIYADDSIYLISSNNRLKNLNGLEVNGGKTVVTEFCTQQKRSKNSGLMPELTVKVVEKGRLVDKQILDSTYCRTLGLNLKNYLSWESHLCSGKKAVLPAVRRQLGALSSLKNVLSFKAKLQLTNALLISRLTYLICIWGNTTNNVVKKAQVVQNMAARFVTGCRRSTNQKILMSRCSWLNIAELTEYYYILQFWKTLRWDKPVYLRDRLQEEDGDYISTDIPCLQITAGAFRAKMTHRWNALPLHLRTEHFISRFKTGLKNLILDKRLSDDEDDDESIHEDDDDQGDVVL